MVQKRYQFYKLKQELGQTIFDFVAKVKAQASVCNFENSLNESILDQCVIDICNIQLLSLLLAEKDLTLNMAINIMQQFESLTEWARDLFN